MFNHHSTLGLPPRTLTILGSRPGQWKPLHLEAVRDRLVDERKREQPEDRSIELGDCRFQFDNAGGAYVRFRGRSRFGTPRPMSSNAMFQLFRVLSRPKHMGLLEQLVEEGTDQDLRMAEGIIRRLVERGHSKHRVRFRTALRHLDPADLGHRLQRLPSPRRSKAPQAHALRTVRIVTAVVSEKYRNYDDARFVSDLLETVSKPEEARVISVHRSSEGFSMRLSMAKGRPAEREPYPMLELRNSEVGYGSTVVAAGLFTLICTNGMHSWKSTGIHRWPHRVEADEVGKELAEVLERIGVATKSNLDDYAFARKIRIGDSSAEALQWAEPRLRSHNLSKAFIRRVGGALDDETTSRHKDGGFALSSLVDAITLSAQGAGYTRRFDLERLAGRLIEEERLDKAA
ncbi:MAG: hypothetical protein VX498_06605 [Myxococcota bacterium]|nr:hypothetical protein [Myxococcota bacterium]